MLCLVKMYIDFNFMKQTNISAVPAVSISYDGSHVATAETPHMRDAYHSKTAARVKLNKYRTAD